MVFFVIYMILTIVIGYINIGLATTGFNPWSVNFIMLIYVALGVIFNIISNKNQNRFLGYNSTTDNTENSKINLTLKWKPAVIIFTLQFIHLNYLMFIPTINQIVNVILMLFLAVYFAFPIFVNSYYNLKGNRWKQYGKYIVMFSLLVILLNFLHGFLADYLIPNARNSVNMNYAEVNELNDLLSINPKQMIFSAVLGGGVIAPIFEELVSRAFLFKQLTKINIVLGYILSSLFFGLLHVDIGSPFLVYEFILSFFKVFSGIILAYSYQKTDSIYIPIIIHFISNIAFFIPMLFFL